MGEIVRKGWRWAGYALLAFGLDCATPPYPSSDILYLFPLFAWYYHINDWHQLLSLKLWGTYIVLSIIVGLLMAGVGALIVYATRGKRKKRSRR